MSEPLRMGSIPGTTKRTGPIAISNRPHGRCRREVSREWPNPTRGASGFWSAYAPQNATEVKSQCSRAAAVPNEPIAARATAQATSSSRPASASSARPRRSSFNSAPGVPSHSLVP